MGSMKEIAVQSATKSEESIERAITKQLAAGTIPDANGDGVADLADVEAYKAELIGLNESKLEYHSRRVKRRFKFIVRNYC